MKKEKRSKNTPALNKARVLELLADNAGANKRDLARILGLKGYKLSDGPTPTSSGSIIAFMDAPEGYEVELIQRAK